MAKAKKGDTVKIHYTGKLKDDTTFDSSLKRDPLEFTIGKGEMMPGLEEAVLGMSPGESKTTEIPADKAYGPRLKENIAKIPGKQFPKDSPPEVGQRLTLQGPDGQTKVVVVIEVSKKQVTLDTNHPLAGEDLVFDIELIEIIDM